MSQYNKIKSAILGKENTNYGCKLFDGLDKSKNRAGSDQRSSI